MQKALASLETGLTGFDEIAIPGAPDAAAITKALAKQTLNAVSFACSSRAAAKHTAKNANLKKTRASYYSGATADAELPFRISAKRAFHNGRPLIGD